MLCRGVVWRQARAARKRWRRAGGSIRRRRPALPRAAATRGLSLSAGCPLAVEWHATAVISLFELTKPQRLPCSAQGSPLRGERGTGLPAAWVPRTGVNQVGSGADCAAEHPRHHLPRQPLQDAWDGNISRLAQRPSERDCCLAAGLHTPQRVLPAGPPHPHTTPPTTRAARMGL